MRGGCIAARGKKKNMPKLHMGRPIGISNRVEVLPLAGTARQACGHESTLDCRKLDSFFADSARITGGHIA